MLLLIAYVGAFTALLAATLALGESDIKRVLAYSTVSQLGYMMTALGAGALVAGVLHLLLHGFFKALLFLAAGAVIHAVHTNDMWAMGRLGRAMPKTAIVFVVGTLALAGVPPFSGFVSKEAILGGVWEAGLRGPFVLLSVTVFLTAFYMFRAVFLTFFGARGAGGPPPRPAGRDDGPAVAPGPAVDRGRGARRARRSARPSRSSWDARRARRSRTGRAGSRPSPSGSRSRASLLAWLVYQRRAVSVEALTRGLGPLPAWAARGYGLDALYVAVYRGVVLALGAARGVDRSVRGRRAGQRGERADAPGGRGPPPAPDRPRPGLPLRRDGGPAPRPGPLAALGVTGCPVLSLVTATPFVAACLIMLVGRTRPLGVRLIAVGAAAADPRRCPSTSTSRTTRRPAASSSASSTRSSARSASRVELGADGISVLMVLLTAIIIFAGVVRVVDGARSATRSSTRSCSRS